MGLESTAGQSSSTVVVMYDPQKLQLRTDVRLEDVPMVTPGTARGNHNRFHFADNPWSSSTDDKLS